ncbi:MAG: hypothetical protein BGO98_32720 [Myxococcales bacterium 68-20]|nr:MAG: hypothetical protein BGO98_32720 [Myxococcales bacterium 68-20]
MPYALGRLNSMARMLAGGVDDLVATAATAAMQASAASENPGDAPSGHVRARCLDRARDQAR